MLDLIIETAANLYDAVIRGICYTITLAIVWLCLFPIVKTAVKLLREVGIW